MEKRTDTKNPAARRLKVGIVCFPTYGGSGAVATELANALACRGHSVHLFSFALPFRLQNLKCDDLMFHQVQPPEYPLFKSYPPYLLSLAAKIAEVTQEVHLDIIHVHYAVPFTLAAVLAAEMSRNHKPRIVTTLHGTDVTLVGQDPAFFEVVRYSLEKSEAITAVSDYLKTTTEKEFAPAAPIQRIYNFVDVDRFNRSQPDPFLANFHEQGFKVISHVSNFRAVKRVLDTIRVYHRIRKDVNARLVLIGEGPELPLAKKLVRELGVE
ncbi:MAG: N-acetyl-alpha-D-glucosaminyl L-malate synthase BshA, partial [bacterium]